MLTPHTYVNRRCNRRMQEEKESSRKEKTHWEMLLTEDFDERVRKGGKAEEKRKKSSNKVNSLTAGIFFTIGKR